MPDSEYNQSYPKWVYAKQGSEVLSRIVKDPEELAGLGTGWAESPAGPFAEKAELKPRPRKRK